MTTTATRFIARKQDDPRGSYGYDIEVDGVVVGHVYEQATDLVSVRWRASVTIDGKPGYASRQSRKRATAAAIDNATRED